VGFFVQQFSIFPRFLEGEWAWISPTLEGIFLVLAKLGGVRGKFFAQQKLKTPRFLSWACSGSDSCWWGAVVSGRWPVASRDQGLGVRDQGGSNFFRGQILIFARFWCWSWRGDFSNQMSDVSFRAGKASMLALCS
jgi:hypothetical protein